MQNVKKTLIQIICLCTDIDNLERTLLLLKQNSLYLTNKNNKIVINVTILLSDYIFDWEKSIIKKDFFIDKLNHLKNYADWADEHYFNADTEAYGSVEIGIKNIYKYDVDQIIWLDVDMIFNNTTLFTFLETASIVSNNTSKYIVSSNLVKMWDDSWNELEHPSFSNEPPDYVLTNDSFVDVNKDYGELSIKQLNNIKFGGGWFTLFSKSLLEYLEIPTTIKGFCPIDTWIMAVCKFIPDVKQYKIENLILCEDRKYTKRNSYNNYLTLTGKNLDYYNKSQDELNAHFTTKLLQKLRHN